MAHARAGRRGTPAAAARSPSPTDAPAPTATGLGGGPLGPRKTGDAAGDFNALTGRLAPPPIGGGEYHPGNPPVERWTPRRAPATLPIVRWELGGNAGQTFSDDGERSARGGIAPAVSPPHDPMVHGERRTNHALRRKVDHLLNRVCEARAEIIERGLDAVHGPVDAVAADRARRADALRHLRRPRSAL